MPRARLVAFALLVAFVAFPPIIRARQVFDPSSSPTHRSGLPRSGEVPRHPLIVIVADEAPVRASDSKPAVRPPIFTVSPDDEVIRNSPAVADGLGLRAPPHAGL